jgi:CheY-like chemotaxis protein
LEQPVSATVLLVEDEFDGVFLVQRVLNSRGIESVAFETAESAFAALVAEPDRFAAAVIDLALPEMDGFELMHAIRSRPELAELPLMAITAFHTPELKVKALESGFNAYLEKPLNTSAFTNLVSSMVR